MKRLVLIEVSQKVNMHMFFLIIVVNINYWKKNCQLTSYILFSYFCNSLVCKKKEIENMQSLLCARFEQQTRQQNDAQKRKKPGFHLNQRCTWVLPVDERDFYRKSRRLSVAGAETKMQRVAANKGARASDWYSRSAAQIFARKQGSNNERESAARRNGSRGWWCTGDAAY